jgi:hypothetical protein
MSPNTTNAMRNIDSFAFRVHPIRARTRILRETCCRQQVSVLNLVHTNRFHEQLRWGHHAGATNVHPGPAKPGSVYCRNSIENLLSLALLGYRSLQLGAAGGQAPAPSSRACSLPITRKQIPMYDTTLCGMGVLQHYNRTQIVSSQHYHKTHFFQGSGCTSMPGNL